MTVVTLRVQHLRHRSARGVIAFGQSVDDPALSRVAVTLPERLCSVPVEPGQWWLVTGPAQTVEYAADGYRFTECRITAEDALFVRPSGEHVVQVLATSPSFPGIGQVAARRLWEAFGDALYSLLDANDPGAFEQLVGPHRAQVLVQGWQSFRDSDALQLMHRLKLEPRVVRRILACYPGEVRERLAEDPYRLLAFGPSWNRVDGLSAEYFGIAPSDPRRLAAAVEAAAYEAFDDGHTWTSEATLRRALANRVGLEHVDEAMALAESAHHVERTALGLHPLGPMAIELAIAEAVRARLAPARPLMNRDEVEAVLVEFERTEAALNGGVFALNDGQRRAVCGVVEHPLLLVTGGAGVGKTTVMKAVKRVLDAAGQTTFLMALSGKAARRLSDATEASAMTIAGFLQNVAPKGLPDSCTLIVDEASMVDAVALYRLLRAVPDTCRLVLLGDPAQLPPVGPGLTLHSLVGCSAVPHVELTETRRFGGELATFANAVREGKWLELGATLDAAVAFVPCSPTEVADVVVALRRDAGDGAQALTFTRRTGHASSEALNRACQAAFALDQPKLRAYNLDHHRWEDSGIRLGEPVLCNRNHWDLGLQNGSLGTVTGVAPSTGDGSDGALGEVRWDDGESRPVTDALLDSLELAYAITVHKAQGSQWPCVIVPVFRSRNLDRTMLYTALTRASQRVVFVGDTDVARRAVEALPSAERRRTAIRFLLERH